MVYNGTRMSFRAYEAYENGEKPLSKWKKDEILDLLSQESELDFSEMTLPMLKEFFLIKSGWHHTGKFYKKTAFYRFEFDPESWNQDQIDYCVAAKKGEKKQKKENNYITARIKYHFRTGSRKHPIYNSEVEIVRFRSLDGKVKTKNGNKLLSKITILNEIEKTDRFLTDGEFIKEVNKNEK